MNINKKRIISVNNIVDKIPSGIEFKVVKSVNNLDFNTISKIGFPVKLESGYKILPNIIGPVSKFNALGKYKPLKHLPKEYRYLYTIYWEWTEYNGDKHSKFVDIYRMCYQREFTPPPSIELTYTTNDESSYIISESLINNESNHEIIKNTINLFLEIFGDCELRYSDLKNITPPITKKVNWEMLPKGEYPWKRENSHIHKKLNKKSSRVKEPIIIRQEQIITFGPDEIYQGSGGFKDYMAYIFKEAGITILESTQYDNATYIFDLNWEEVSQLTKADILQNNLQKARVIHSEGWLIKLSKHFPPFYKNRSA